MEDLEHYSYYVIHTIEMNTMHHYNTLIHHNHSFAVPWLLQLLFLRSALEFVFVGLGFPSDTSLPEQHFHWLFAQHAADPEEEHYGSYNFTFSIEVSVVQMFIYTVWPENFGGERRFACKTAELNTANISIFLYICIHIYQSAK